MRFVCRRGWPRRLAANIHHGPCSCRPSHSWIEHCTKNVERFTELVTSLSHPRRSSTPLRADWHPARRVPRVRAAPTRHCRALGWARRGDGGHGWRSGVGLRSPRRLGRGGGGGPRSGPQRPRRQRPRRRSGRDAESAAAKRVCPRRPGCRGSISRGSSSRRKRGGGAPGRPLGRGVLGLRRRGERLEASG